MIKYLSVIFLSVLFLYNNIPLKASEQNLNPDNPFFDQENIAISNHGIWLYDAKSKQKKWHTLVGKHLYEPVIADSKVFIGSTSGLFALEKKTGKTSFQFMRDKNLFSSIIMDDRLFVTSDSGDIWSLDRSSGSIIWHLKLEGWVYPMIFLQGNLILGGQSGFITALDPNTSKIVWNFKLDGELTYKPIEINDKYFAVSIFTGFTYLIHAKNGSLIWKVKDKTPFFSFVADKNSITYAGFGLVKIRDVNNGKLLFEDILPGKILNCTSFSDGVFMISNENEIRLYSSQKPTLIWSKKWNKKQIGHPVSNNKYFFTILNGDQEPLIKFIKKTQLIYNQSL